MITKRDQDILNFIEEFHIATSSQIHKLFFDQSNYRYCMQRLQQLYNIGFLKRARSTISNEHAYYIKKPSLLQQMHHDLVRSELFVNINKTYKILAWNNEEPIKNIRPDAMVYVQNSAFTYINDHGIVFPVFIEIHLNNKFNFDKYKDLLKNNDLKAMFGLMPRVVICTDRQVTPPQIGIRFKVVGIDMKGLDTIFK